MNKIKKFLFGIICRICCKRYHMGGGKIKTTYDTFDICPTCCFDLEQMNTDIDKRVAH